MKRCPTRWCAVLAILALLPSVLGAQAPAAVLALAQFRDSLRATRDARLIHTIEHQLHAAADAHRGDAITRLRLGFVQLRRGELEQHRSAFSDADQTFDAVVASHIN